LVRPVCYSAAAVATEEGYVTVPQRRTHFDLYSFHSKNCFL